MQSYKASDTCLVNLITYSMYLNRPIKHESKSNQWIVNEGSGKKNSCSLLFSHISCLHFLILNEKQKLFLSIEINAET